MVLIYEQNKYLDVISARRSESGDIEVLASNCDIAISVYLVEYELDWFVVIEEPSIFQDDPHICDFEVYRIENQEDVHRLNAAL